MELVVLQVGVGVPFPSAAATVQEDTDCREGPIWDKASEVAPLTSQAERRNPPTNMVGVVVRVCV